MHSKHWKFFLFLLLSLFCSVVAQKNIGSDRSQQQDSILQKNTRFPDELEKLKQEKKKLRQANKEFATKKKKNILTDNQFLFNGLNLNYYHTDNYETLIPSYYVDPYILYLTNKRLQQCQIIPTKPFNTNYQLRKPTFPNETFLSSKTKINPENIFQFAMQELSFLYDFSAIEYFRGHELLAYHYFVEYLHQNLHYQPNYFEAEMEYLPILPLHWRVITIGSSSPPSSTKDAPSGGSAGSSSTTGGCDYSSFIQYLLEVEYYLEERDTSLLSESYKRSFSSIAALPPKFLIASTYNMRTMWGRGMASQIRKGKDYNTITNFVQNISGVGHYERWPQCPDLLRKWWKYVVELPYLPMVSKYYHLEDLIMNSEQNIELGGLGQRGRGGNGANLHVEAMNLFNPINAFGKYQGLIKQREENYLQSLNDDHNNHFSFLYEGEQKKKNTSSSSTTLREETEGLVRENEEMNLMGAPNENLFIMNTDPGMPDSNGGQEGGGGGEQGNAKKKSITFLFIGNFELVGPNKVCSMRSILQSLQPRPDLTMVYLPLEEPFPGNELIDEEESIKSANYWKKYQSKTFPPSENGGKGMKPVLTKMHDYIEKSIFCVITGSTSYSSAFFYHSILGDCLPIVINDWFVFAFPWLVAYETFTIRVLENDFMKNPHWVLDYIKDKFLPTRSSSTGKTSTDTDTESINLEKTRLLNNMRKCMFKMKSYLSYETIPFGSGRYQKLLFSDIHYYYHYHYNPNIMNNNNKQSSSSSSSSSSVEKKVQTILPLELFLLELRYAQKVHKYYNNIPCMRPYMCFHHYQKHVYQTAIPTPTVEKEKEKSKKATNRSPPTAPGVEEYDYQWYEEKTPDGKKKKQKGVIVKYFNSRRIEKIITSRYGLLFSKSSSFLSSSSNPTNSSAENTKNDQKSTGIPIQYDTYQVHALYFDPSLASSRSSSPFTDQRPYLCKHNPRLIGNYKIVFFMQCVRVLWTLNPGKLKPHDLAMINYNQSVDSVYTYYRPSSAAPSPPTIPTALAIYEKDYILAFHNISRPKNWIAANYPVGLDNSHLIKVQN
jgi:hypothetical protein